MIKEDCCSCGVTFLSEEPANICTDCLNEAIVEKLQTTEMSAEEFKQYARDALECLFEIVNSLDGENKVNALAIMKKNGLN
jgi:hypothetical protein